MTDRRVMSNMDGEAKLIHLRLEAWGNWSKTNPELRPYPVATLLHRVAEQGLAGAAQGGGPVSMPEPIRITEIAVLSLPTDERVTIADYYLQWAPMEMLAAKRRMTVDRFSRLLRAGRQHVAWYVKGMEDAPDVKYAG